jgi:hypothetical protein
VREQPSQKSHASDQPDHEDRVRFHRFCYSCVAPSLAGPHYARFVVTEPPPNVVITFSHKGLTRLFAELIGLGIGGLGVFLSGIAFARGARNGALTLAALGNVSICVVCAALLM